MLKINIRVLFTVLFVICNLLQIVNAQDVPVSKPDWTIKTFKKDPKVVKLLQKIEELVLNQMTNTSLNLRKENYSKISDIGNDELRKFLGTGYYLNAEEFFEHQNSYIVVSDNAYKKMKAIAPETTNFSVYLLPNESSCLDARYLTNINKGIIFWPTLLPRYTPEGNTEEEKALHYKKFIHFENKLNTRSILELDKNYGRLFLAANRDLCLIKISVEIIKEPSK